jgi:carbon monoxide dehydrogenase subunit G
MRFCSSNGTGSHPVAIGNLKDHTCVTQERIMPMEMTGEFRIPAPRQRVWEGLNDPEILKSVIPGCQTLEKVSDTEFTGKIVAAIGPVKATFAGKVLLSDLDPPQSYTISGEGSGGVAGFAKGSAKVNLAEDGVGTVLNYAVQAHVGGKLAQIGSRLIDSAFRRRDRTRAADNCGERRSRDRSRGGLARRGRTAACPGRGGADNFRGGPA